MYEQIMEKLYEDETRKEELRQQIQKKDWHSEDDHQEILGLFSFYDGLVTAWREVLGLLNQE